MARHGHQGRFGEDVGQGVFPQGIEDQLKVAAVEDAEKGRVGAEGQGVFTQGIQYQLKIATIKNSEECRIGAQGKTGKGHDGAADLRAKPVVGAAYEEIGTNFAEPGAVELGDLHLQHHLLHARHAEQVDDPSAGNGGLSVGT